ncbi:reverse transcriptase [Phytophthora megakarya]|uniref:Reverse transcriptase n=1 Tax=Phytophthora megakarya TaxID=4795 RepID=A0A225VYN3_9STRA|nr:reverse transcriptase [Phytophthora megakarya]
MLEDLDHKRLVICGDSILVIRQPKAFDRLKKWSDHELVHVKLDWNGSADSLASATLQRQDGIEVQGGPGYQDLVTLNRLDETLIPRTEKPVRLPLELLEQDHLRVACKKSDPGDAGRSDQAGSGGGSLDRGYEEISEWLDRRPHPSISKIIVVDYEVDKQDLLFYCQPNPRSGDDHDRLLKLVVPKMLQSDLLNHYHTTLEGGHQGVGRTYQRTRDHFYWRGLYRSVQRYVGE